MAAATARRPADLAALPPPRLIAVTKTQPVETMREALAAGLTAFGENRVQEMTEKWSILDDPAIGWHQIGSLQRNKVKYIVERVALIHSVDSVELAREIDRQAARFGRDEVSILIQINTSDEASKGGVRPDEAAALLAEIDALPHVRPLGLMTIAAAADDDEQARPEFRRLRTLRDELNAGRDAGRQLSELSMGMTGDFEIAIEEGATMVRIGSALFGTRS